MNHESMEFDVLIIGAGPAGLSAAIRLGQLNQELSQQGQKNLSIGVLEKGATIGAHIISGAILEPTALNELIPDWPTKEPPIHTPATHDQFFYLSEKKAYGLPVSPAMKNEGNYIISLGKFCTWLSVQAEQLGVNIFPGFAASKILYSKKGHVIGVKTDDKGRDSIGHPTQRFQPGIHIYAKQTLFAEGCRGSLSEDLIHHFNLRKNCDPQTYAIGLKEIWKIPEDLHQLGHVVHTIGWPLDTDTYGGSFIYHLENNQLALGLVIGLDYKNTYLDPFAEFQRFKTHPLIKPLLENGECLSFGARALNEGGWQSIPKLTAPGAMLIGCAAGFVNVAKIKGIHTAMKSGMLAAEAIFTDFNRGSEKNEIEITRYEEALKNSWVDKELYLARNLRPAFKKGLWKGLSYAAIDQYLFHGKAPWTFHNLPDHLELNPAALSKKINYPKPDGKITFDRSTQVFLTGTHYREDQPCHLLIKDPLIPTKINLNVYAGPEQRYCPAGVYEFVEKNNEPHLQINFTNCIQCKTCDIKDPLQNIKWVVPEGGDGPNYRDM